MQSFFSFSPIILSFLFGIFFNFNRPRKNRPNINVHGGVIHHQSTKFFAEKISSTDCVVDHENNQSNFGWKNLRYDDEGNILWSLRSWWGSLQNRTDSREVGKFNISMCLPLSILFCYIIVSNVWFSENS